MAEPQRINIAYKDRELLQQELSALFPGEHTQITVSLVCLLKREMQADDARRLDLAGFTLLRRDSCLMSVAIYDDIKKQTDRILIQRQR